MADAHVIAGEVEEKSGEGGRGGYPRETERVERAARL